jgi:peptidoglycan LD-endopeptidase LytH
MLQMASRAAVSLLCAAVLATGGQTIAAPANGDRGAAPGAAGGDGPAPTALARAAPLPRLAVPVAGVAPASLRDTYAQARAGHPHEAIDIPAATGTPVYAVDDGTVAMLHPSVPGGLTLYQFDRSGTVAYYYAHLDRYADGLRAGQRLARCDLIGYVGTTGNAAPDAPHLHFAVFVLGPERQWWRGTPMNPYDAMTGRGVWATTGPAPRCE